MPKHLRVRTVIFLPFVRKSCAAFLQSIFERIEHKIIPKKLVIFAVIVVLFIAEFCSSFFTSTVFATTNTINFQGKITNTNGTNLIAGSPSCVAAGADTCDIRFAIYSDSSASTLLWREDHLNLELGDKDGIFSLRLNSVCGGWTSTGSGSCLIQNGGVTFRANLYYVVFFDTDGNGDFSSPERFPTSNTTEMSSVSQALGVVGANGENISNSVDGTVKVADSGGTNFVNVNTNGTTAVAKWFEFANGTDTVAIATGTQNPSSVATNADIGSLFLNSSSGAVYVKTDDGSSTNWSQLATTTTGTLDTAYTNDSDKVMTVNNAAGLQFNNTSSGNVDINLASTGDFTVSDNGTPFATFTDSGTITLAGDVTISSPKTLTLAGLSTAGGIAFTNASGTLGTTAQGTTNQCLTSAGSGTPTWADCATYGSNWQISSGALQPKNLTTDLLLGGTATTSAKFGVLNINSGTPTASLSAGVAGGAFLTSTGTLATTALQNLTLGNTTTQNVILNPNLNVGIGVTVPLAPLHISKGFSNNAAFIVNNTFSGDLIAASSSGATRFRVTAAGDLVSVAGAKWQPLTNSTSALNIANAAGTSFVSFDTTNNNVGIGVTTPASKLDIQGGYGANASLTVNQTLNGDILTASTSGTTMLRQEKEGDLTIGNVAKSDVDVKVFGDIFQQSNTVSLPSFADPYFDGSIYDTSKDPDAGAWTDSKVSRQLSWYTETKDDGPGDLCSTTVDDRCGRSAFPKKAYIVQTNTGVFIFDSLSSKLWMALYTSSTNAIKGPFPISSRMFNGKLYVGTTGDGLMIIDFKKDQAFRLTSSGAFQYAGNISQRNSGSGFTSISTLPNIASNTVYAIAPQVINGKVFTGVATSITLDVFNESDNRLFSYSDNTNDAYYGVALSSAGNLYGQNVSRGQLELWRNVQSDLASRTNGTPDKLWDETSTPALFNAAPSFNQYFSSGLRVDEASSLVSGSSDTVYSSSTVGLARIQTAGGNEGLGSVKYYTKDYISEEMVGDIRGMWPLTSELGSGLSDASRKAFTLTNNNTATFTSSGVRGFGVTTNGTNQFLSCSDASCGGTSGTDIGSGNFSVGGWVKTSQSALSTIMGKGTTATYSWQLQKNASGKAVFLLQQAANTTFASATSTTSINDGKWHHVVGVFNQGAGAYVRIYVDGVLESTSTSTSGTLNTDSTAAFQIGALADSTNFFSGTIDEAFVSGTLYRPETILSMYLSGRQALQMRTISVNDATSATSTTIVDTGETWTPNEFVGGVVEIFGGTGIGQTRTVISNTATALTVSPAWSATPDTTSDFHIKPHRLYGASSIVNTVGISDDGPGRDRQIFVGTNDSADGGGFTVLDLDGDKMADAYHGLAGKTDDNGTAWNTTTNYDNAVAADYRSGTLLLISNKFGWTEREARQESNQFDRLRNDVLALQKTRESAVLAISQQNDTTDTQVGYQVIRKGWGWQAGDGATTSIDKGINFGITYDETPTVFVSFVGTNTTANPTDLSQCTTSDVSSFAGNAYATTPSSMRAVVRTTGANIPVATRVCFTWMAIGTYRQGYTSNISPYAAGADLAEWYATPDKTLEAGEVVAVNPDGDISVIKSTQPYQSSAIGIVATQPAITLGPQSGMTPGYDQQSLASGSASVAVALGGRVPVKVSLENGPIRAGDSLTTSSTPGVAMKATAAGQVIGKALENFDGKTTLTAMAKRDAVVDSVLVNGQQTATAATASQTAIENPSEVSTELQVTNPDLENLTQGIGRIMVFVNTSYADGRSGATTPEQLATTLKLSTNSHSSAPSILTTQPPSDWSATSLSSPSAIAPKTLRTHNSLANLNGNLLSAFSATDSSLIARHQLSDLNLEDTDISLTSTSLSSEKYLEVGGDTFIAGQLGVGQSLILGRGLQLNDAGFDFITPGSEKKLSILGSGKGSLSILNGKLEIDETGLLKIDGDLDLQGKLRLNGQLQVTPQVAGEVKVPAGQTELRFVFEKPFENDVFIQVVAVDGEKNVFRLKDVNKQGFTLMLEEPYQMERRFNWLVVERK